MVYKKRQKCAICGNQTFSTIFNYGKVSLAGDFPKQGEKCDTFPLSLLFCNHCKLLQTDSIIDKHSLFDDYRYISSVGLAAHFDSVADLLIAKYKLNETSNVLDVGSNSAPLLKPLLNKGVKHSCGIDPAKNIVQGIKHKESRDKTIVDYFSESSAKKHFTPHTYDLITCNNCFAHIEDIQGVVKGVKYCLKEHGHLVIEIAYLKPQIDNLAYTNFYHEHLYYYSLSALANLFNKYNMTIVDFEEIPVHSGSLRVHIQNGRRSGREVNNKVSARFAEEDMWGLTHRDYFNDFGQRVRNNRNKIKEGLKDLKSKGKKIVGYGASGRATMLCNYCGLGPETIDYIVDESPEREGREIANMKIPIVSKDVLINDKVDYIFLFADNFAKMIMNKLDKHNYTFLVPCPELKIIRDVKEVENSL